ncbi:MAG: hypothetical protein IKD62_00200 [Oscillospiraceae bacterium]|nr:hypothetical protein [Oscillospiraceae bacterium]MBR2706854.1 hypothetical protein [Mogibacterium sp.]
MSREDRILSDKIRIERIKADRKSLIKLLAVFMLGVFVLIGMRSYGAIIQHENNVLAEENAYIQAEIDSLNSQIVEETKVTRIEKVATEDFGMVYPTPDNCIRLGDDDDDDKGLAEAIRTEAYK